MYACVLTVHMEVVYSLFYSFTFMSFLLILGVGLVFLQFGGQSLCNIEPGS